jgi:hypothetical protein
MELHAALWGVQHRSKDIGAADDLTQELFQGSQQSKRKKLRPHIKI